MEMSQNEGGWIARSTYWYLLTFIETKETKERVNTLRIAIRHFILHTDRYLVFDRVEDIEKETINNCMIGNNVG